VRPADPSTPVTEAAAARPGSLGRDEIVRVGYVPNVNAFHVIGGLFAVWAVTLAALGIKREDFPQAGRQTLAVGALSVLLAASAIGSGIITSALEAEEKEEEEAEEGTPADRPAAGEGGGRTLTLKADSGGELRFDARSLEARAGEVTIRMENPSSVPHNVSIEGGGVDEEGKTVGRGGTSTVRADLAPGEYAFYCSVSGHRPGGMEGALIVR
jgi:plastocyanin